MIYLIKLFYIYFIVKCGGNMREKQIILIPTDKSKKSKNMVWSEALIWAKTDDEGLVKIIDEGIEVNGCYLDEALIYDNQLS